MEAGRPLISVMIGVYNAAPYLGEAIDSIVAQSYRPIELIVVDDGSDDGSAEIAKGYGDLLTYAYQENAGDGAARNAAVRLATGSMFAFMDADDRSTPNRFELEHAALEADPQLDAVFGHTVEFVSPELTAEQRAGVRPPFEGKSPWVAPSVMLIRREAYARVGPFSEELRLGSTVDWCSRAIDLGLKTLMLPDVLMERRLHTSNLGLRAKDARDQYVEIVKASLLRRRARSDDSAAG